MRLMERNEYNAAEPIAALATPWGQSALAVVRVSGPGSLGLLERVCTAPLQEAPGHSLRRGRLIDRFSKPPEPIDEVLVAVYRAPRSFTGEEAAEIFTHGSPVILRRVLALLFQAGFRQAGPGEFTLRAFLNGKLDLTEAEAVNELVRAKTDRARALALRRLSGSVEGKIRQIKERLVGLLAAVEARLDYPEEELPGELAPAAELEGLERELESLAASYRIGRIYQEGVSAVLAGRTNSGKSTLFNRLLREERAIVDGEPGTTRDYLEGLIELEGVPVRLYDTAGYRNAAGAVEREGIKRTDAIVAEAQLVLYLVDSSEGLAALDEEFLSQNAGDGRLIRVWTKTDLGDRACPPGFLPVSAREGRGIAELAGAMTERILAGTGPSGDEAPVIDSLRQKELLERALQAWRAFRRGLEERLALDLAAVDLKEALDALGEITGEVTSQDILNAVFSRFCVGK
jgi:tRNA modification GTPase